MAGSVLDPSSWVKKVHFIMGKVKITYAQRILTYFTLAIATLHCSHLTTKNVGAPVTELNKTTVTTADNPIQLKAELRGDYSYLSVDIFYPPVQGLKESLEKSLAMPLKNRGEAHITLISPVEYKEIKSELPIEKLYEVLSKDFLHPKIQLSCLGEGHAVKAEKKLSTYFIVVKSENLLLARKKIKSLLSSKTSFDPLNYYPHITVGFTEKDLHFEDGVIKNSTSCSTELSKLMNGFAL